MQFYMQLMQKSSAFTYTPQFADEVGGQASLSSIKLTIQSAPMSPV